MSSSKTRTAVCLISIAFGASIGFGAFSTEVESATKYQCKSFANGSTKGLAVMGSSNASACVCPPQSSAYQRRERRPGAATTDDCYIQTPQKITNFNQPPNNPPGTPPGEPPVGPPPTDNLLGFNPGNHKNVGKATETPPRNTAPATASSFGVDLSSPAPNGNCCAGGDKGRSNGS
jgi:hypothetical protein